MKKFQRQYSTKLVLIIKKNTFNTASEYYQLSKMVYDCVQYNVLAATN